MPEWDHDHCDPAMEVEHKRLYRMMERLEPVITGRDMEDIRVSRAIGILCERMADHFQVEEDLFLTADWNSRQVMIQDHQRLMAMLDTLSRLPIQEQERRRTLFESFLEELERHDNDVDAPLFSVWH